MIWLQWCYFAERLRVAAGPTNSLQDAVSDHSGWAAISKGLMLPTTLEHRNLEMMTLWYGDGRCNQITIRCCGSAASGRKDCSCQILMVDLMNGLRDPRVFLSLFYYRRYDIVEGIYGSLNNWRNIFQAKCGHYYNPMPHNGFQLEEFIRSDWIRFSYRYGADNYNNGIKSSVPLAWVWTVADADKYIADAIKLSLWIAQVIISKTTKSQNTVSEN